MNVATLSNRLSAQRQVPSEPQKEARNVVRRRRHQKGYLYKTGKRRKVWRARWVEPVMFADGIIGSVLRNEIIAEVRDVPSAHDEAP